MLEGESLLASRKGLKELAGKDTTIVAVLLLWRVLRSFESIYRDLFASAYLQYIVLPTRKVEWRILLLPVFFIEPVP